MLTCQLWFLKRVMRPKSSVAAVQSCFCFIIVVAAIVLGIGALFLLFVLLYSQRVASQSCETLGELLHHCPRMERIVTYRSHPGQITYTFSNYSKYSKFLRHRGRHSFKVVSRFNRATSKRVPLKFRCNVYI